MSQLVAEQICPLNRAVSYGIALASIPWVLAALNPIWLNNTPGDWDVWMYYGYLNHLFQFSEHFIWAANAYIGTRIPYLLPGYIVHQTAGDDLYRYVFNIGMVYSSIIFSYFYALRKYMPLNVAAATTVLIATNLYLLRSIGWDYVDKAVTAYSALTFAFLTLAGSSRRPWLTTIAAGFTATSMIFVHIASALMFPVFFFYSVILVRRAGSARQWWGHFLYLLLFCGVGAAIAQALWGALMVALHGGEFFFFLKQARLVAQNLGAWNAPLPVLVTGGYWITYDLAAFLGSCAALIATRFGLVQHHLSTFEAFWLWTITIVFGGLFLGEITGSLWLLSRDGMHSTLFLPFSMIGFGILLFRQPSPYVFPITFVCCMITVLVLLGFNNGDGLSTYANVPMVVIAGLAGTLLVIAFVINRSGVSIAALLLICIVMAFNKWHFTDDRDVRKAHARIASKTASKLPSIFFDQRDPGITIINGILASFTDRALVTSRTTYPTLRDGMKAGDFAVVLSSHEADVNAARINLLRYVSDAATVDSFRSGPVWAHVFAITAGR